MGLRWRHCRPMWPFGHGLRAGWCLVESVSPRIRSTSPQRGEVDLRSKSGEGAPHSRRDHNPLYLHIEKKCAMEATERFGRGPRPKRAAMSPDTPPATTVGEPGTFAVVTYDRTVA